MKLTRRDTFAAAFGAAAAGAVPASAAASPSAATLPELALRARSMTPDDRLRGVVGYVLRRCEEGEKPNAWAAYGQKLEHGGIIYDSESLARYAAERDWPIIRDIQIEAGQLRRKLKAKRIPFEESDARIEIEGAPATHLLFVCETVHEIARHMERNKDSWVYRRAVA